MNTVHNLYETYIGLTATIESKRLSLLEGAGRPEIVLSKFSCAAKTNVLKQQSIFT